MNRNIRVFIILLLSILIFVLCSCGSSYSQDALKEAYKEGYNQGYSIGYDAGVDFGYDEGQYDASHEPGYSVDAMRRSFRNIGISLDYALRILDNPDDYTFDDLYAAIEDARSFCYDYE